MRSAPLASLTPSRLAALSSQTFSELQALADTAPDHYSRFTVRKSSGTGHRVITPPSELLGAIQRAIHKYINSEVRWQDCVHGGPRNRSIFTNAAPHIKQEIVATLDIANFYPSVSSAATASALARAGCPHKSIETIVKLGTLDNSLPQGSPLSQTLGNLVLLDVDLKFSRPAKRHSLRYSRYVDDITVSGGKNIKDFHGAFVDSISASNFSVKEEKIKYQPRSGPQLVTGLVVNDIVTPPPAYISSIKDRLRICTTDVSALTEWAYDEDKRPADLIRSLRGKINYIGHSKPQKKIQLLGLLTEVLRKLKESQHLPRDGSQAQSGMR